MMTKKYILFAIVSILIFSLQTKVFCWTLEANDAIAEQTLDQETKADIVVYFEDWDRIFIEKPYLLTEEPFSLKDLQIFLDEFEGKKGLAVVLLGKNFNLLEKDELQQKLDMIKNIFDSYEFSNFVIQQAFAFGRGIYTK